MSKGRIAIILSGLAAGALVLVVISGYRSNDDPKRYWPGQYRSDLTDAAESAVKNRLNDPYSAQFSMVEVVDATKGARVVCGWVNAKNQMGGYVGPRPFVFHEASKSAAIRVLSTDNTALVTNTKELQSPASAARFKPCDIEP